MRGRTWTWIAVRKCAIRLLWCLGVCAVVVPREARAQWAAYGCNAQHTALAAGPSQLPLVIRWQTPVDLDPQYSGNDLLIHYGSPAITAANTMIVPVKTGANGGFSVNGINATTGALIWTMTTDYVLPSHNWTPPMGLTLTPGDQSIAVPAAGGTVLCADQAERLPEREPHPSGFLRAQVLHPEPTGFQQRDPDLYAYYL